MVAIQELFIKKINPLISNQEKIIEKIILELKNQNKLKKNQM